MSDPARKTIHRLVDELPDEDLATAKTLLQALGRSASADELEDVLDAHQLRQLRDAQADDSLEPLDAFGKRHGLE